MNERILTNSRASLGLEDMDTQLLVLCSISDTDTLTITMVYDMLGTDNNLKQEYTPVSSAPEFITGPLYTLLSLSVRDTVKGLGKKVGPSDAWVVVEREQLRKK